MCAEYFVVLVSWFIIKGLYKYLTKDEIYELLNNVDVRYLCAEILQKICMTFENGVIWMPTVEYI